MWSKASVPPSFPRALDPAVREELTVTPEDSPLSVGTEELSVTPEERRDTSVRLDERPLSVGGAEPLSVGGAEVTLVRPEDNPLSVTPDNSPPSVRAEELPIFITAAVAACVRVAVGLEVISAWVAVGTPVLVGLAVVSAWIAMGTRVAVEVGTVRVAVGSVWDTPVAAGLAVATAKVSASSAWVSEGLVRAGVAAAAGE